tara:strand:- start:3493 stop:5103 length:1611 start_codon:yes stop_codon:yes gene_type:complete
MKINSIKIEGFLSVRNAEINFDNYFGITNIQGLNEDTNPISSNGAGKSTIIEAVSFALFGKTIRKTTEKNLRYSLAKIPCKVQITVNDNVVITRTKKPPSLLVEVDGKSYTKEGILQTQDYLEKFLNINYNVFLASMVFGQQNSMNFLSATPEEKRSIIQNFLNISDLFKHRSKIRSLKTKFSNEKKVSATLQAESMQKVNNLKGTSKKLKNSLDKGEKTLKEADISFVKKFSISELQEIENKRNEMVLNCQGVENQLNTAVNTISRLKDNIEKYEKNTTCEHCNKKPRVIWEQLESDKAELEKSYKTRDTLMKKLTKLNREIDDYHIPIKSSDFELIENLKNIETEIKVIKKQIRNQQTISRKHSVEMEEAQKKYDLMRFWEQAFSEQGLIKYIIRNILEFFNTRSNYYLNILSKGVFSIEFDEVLTEYISNGLGEVSFDTLSGGEKKKVSLAVMLSLNDLLRLSGKEKSNIIFFDEVADSLDKEGVKGLCELIDELKEDKKVFIISHNEYLTSIIEDEATELVVKKKQGTTSFA